MNNPLVSVIVPVYNVERYVYDCIFSIISQTYTNLEIIIVDDGTQDKSGVICDEFAAQDSRISVIHKHNEGLSIARNIGFSKSSGELILFVDSDDWLSENMIERLVSEMNATDSDIVVCRYAEEYTDRTIEKSDWVDLGTYEQPEITRIILSDLVNSCVWNKLCRRHVLTRKFPEKRMYEDHATMFAWFGVAKKVSFIGDVLYHYRQRKTGFINQFNDTAERSYMVFQAELDRYEYALSHGFSEIGRRELMRRAKLCLKRNIKSCSSFAGKCTYCKLIGDALKPERSYMSLYLNKKNILRINILWLSPVFFVFYRTLFESMKKKKTYSQTGLFE